MGMFDFFSKDSKTKDERTERIKKEFDLSPEQNSTPQNGPVSVFSPSSYSDVQTIIDALKSGKTAVVHLTELKTETAIRVLDMLSGAVYALNGGVYEMQKNIFMFSPTGIELN